MVGDLTSIAAAVRRANAALAKAYPGDSGDRQPVHTVYGGAHLFRHDSARKLGDLALAALQEYAPQAETFARTIGLQSCAPEGDQRFALTVCGRVTEKLRREPVEDFRIDFEDGYGHRSDAEEDGHARAAAAEVARGLEAGTLPAFIGIRIKPMSAELHVRGLRTLDLFLTALARATRRRLPPNFIVTIPKVMAPAQAGAVARACTAIERRLRLRRGAIALELMIETPQAILDVDGRSGLRALVAAGQGRVAGAHFGPYDYTALCGITGAWQGMGHPACDFARHMMQVALAQSGVRLADGPTTLMPVPVHRARPGEALTEGQRGENHLAVHRAWKLHFDDVRHSLAHGYYQGWDLHPAQLPTRYAAVYSFFLAERASATARLRNFIEQATQATLAGHVFDDAATGQGLLNFFLRGLSSGALTPDEARETGLTLEELQGRSFQRVMEGRRRR